ncbi:MAG: hypothetical protein ACD_79C00995G0001 [uncultured bacterium]|nr:MAG: hypothetical protein ACD_79C00995G0001 [uncultured bacterium]
MGGKILKLVFSMMILFFSYSAFALDTTEGVITERGFGKFYMEDAKGMRLHILEAKKTTTYTPNTWRPANGDKIKVAYFQKPGRGGAMNLVASNIELVEGGALTLNMKSPMEVEVLEMGRSKILVNVIAAKQSMRFDKPKNSQLVPVGWAPMPGEKATITFHATPAKFSYDMVYVIDKMERKAEQ